MKRLFTLIMALGVLSVFAAEGVCPSATKNACSQASAPAICPKAAEAAKNCPKAAKANCPKAVLQKAEVQNPNRDEVFQWIPDGKGNLQLVYVWPKKARIYAISVANNQNVLPGREAMTIVPEGRSKGKVKITAAGKISGIRSDLVAASAVEAGQVLLTLTPTMLMHDSVNNADNKSAALPGWGSAFSGLWHSTGLYDIIRQTSTDFASTWTLGLGRVLMSLVALVLIYLAIGKEFEPLLLLPIGFGALLANIPLAGISGPDGLQGMIYQVGIESGVFPLLIFMGVGAMTDFGPLLANPKTSLLGGAAQLGIFTALLGALGLTAMGIGIDFSLKDAASIGIIGGADGPTSIYLTSKLSPKLLGAVAVAAYSYMALVPIIQPPIMRLLTTQKERKIRMRQLRNVPKLEKVCFPILITVLCALLLPDAAPLIGMLMFGNLMRECGVVERLNQTAQNALINIVTIFLGLAVGSKLSAEQFLSLQTVGILVLGAVAFSIGTAGGVIFAKIMNLFSKEPINPLIGAAGVSAVPMAARVVNKVGLETDKQNFLLMHAMGPNVAGVIGSAVAAGILLNQLGKFID
ncbi:MAG: sodium ion-translocating decarboxylase subunit beta [Victivallaceae bacterium]|nr:sodium ion-translocating decarboxylase subunit beta [Victivallaceae bacterium]